MAGNQYYRTPDIFFNAMERKFGKFDLDVAADAANTKCEFYMDESLDALNVLWGEVFKSSIGTHTPGVFNNVFCNPPWVRPLPWIKSAMEFTCATYGPVHTVGWEPIKDRQAVMLLHSAFCAKRWWGWVQKWADEVVIPTHERVEFIDPLTKESKSGNMRDNMILVFRYRANARPKTEQLPVSFWDWNNNGD